MNVNSAIGFCVIHFIIIKLFTCYACQSTQLCNRRWLAKIILLDKKNLKIEFANILFKGAKTNLINTCYVTQKSSFDA